MSRGQLFVVVWEKSRGRRWLVVRIGIVAHVSAKENFENFQLTLRPHILDKKIHLHIQNGQDCASQKERWYVLNAPASFSTICLLIIF